MLPSTSQPLPSRIHIFDFSGVFPQRLGKIKAAKVHREAPRSMRPLLAFCSLKRKGLEAGSFFSQQQALFPRQLSAH